MEKYVAVFRVKDTSGKYRYGYTWLKKKHKSKAISTVNAKMADGETIANIWTTDWREQPHTYTNEVGDMPLPLVDLIPMIRGQAHWRERGKSWTDKKKTEAKVSKPVFQQTYYKLTQAPTGDEHEAI